jgi:hypothetical protein
MDFRYPDPQTQTLYSGPISLSICFLSHADLCWVRFSSPRGKTVEASTKLEVPRVHSKTRSVHLKECLSEEFHVEFLSRHLVT